MPEKQPFVSVIVPAYNSAGTIRITLAALNNQIYPKKLYEIIVVDDGSRDETADVSKEIGARVLAQRNQGAGVARNLGAKEATGEIILFTDSDCEPERDWIERMVAPFKDPAIAGVKGFYKTRQTKSTARFAQLEYDIKCDLLKKQRYIDFIDTYSAAYRRDVFLDSGGFDAVYTTASGEDSELSYKLALAGHKLVAAPDAFVYHLHPDTILKYLKKKYRNAYWRVLTWKKYPSKIMKDSHTPNSYKLEVALAPLVLGSFLLAFLWPGAVWLFALLVVLFVANELNFILYAHKRQPNLLPVVPMFLYLRGLAAATGAGVKMAELMFAQKGKQKTRS